jgi:protein-L-isoaspartate O-methyltransferase
MQAEYDFSKYEAHYSELAERLPAFECRFALSLDERRKYTVFSSILDRYLIQVEASDSVMIAKARKSFIRAVVEELTLYLHSLYDEAFSDISLEKAKKLAKESAIKCSSKHESKLTYGEINFFSFVNILERLQPKQGDSFVDLGHGTGRSMVCADLLYGHMFSSICGIEIIPELNAASEGVLVKLKELLKDREHIFASHSAELSVFEGDFTVQDYFDWSTVGITRNS